MNRRITLAFIHASIDDLDLPGSTLKVYLKLVRRADRRGFTFQSSKKLADQMTLSERTIKGAMKDLVELGLIARVTTPKPKGGSSSKYYILDRDEWVGQGKADGAKSAPSETIPTVQKTTADGAKSAPSLDNDLNPRLLIPKRGASARFEAVDPVPSEWLEDPAFVEAWDGWLEVRTKKSNTPRAAILNSKLLAALGKTHAIATLNKSAASGWRGLFPDKTPRAAKAAREFAEPKIKPSDLEL